MHSIQRWLICGALLCLCVGLPLLWFANQAAKETAERGKAVSQNEPTIDGRVAALIQNVRNAGGFEAVLRGTISYQGPVTIRIASRRPDFLFIQTERFGDNPASWYWYEGGKLTIYDEWERRGSHGVCVTNILALTGNDHQRAFNAVVEKSAPFAIYGSYALEALRLCGGGGAAHVTVSNSENSVLASVDVPTNSPMHEFVPDGGLRPRLLLMESGERGSSSIRFRYDSKDEGSVKIPDEAGFVAEIVSIRPSVTRNELVFPNPPGGAVQSIECAELNSINADALNRAPLVKSHE